VAYAASISQTAWSFSLSFSLFFAAVALHYNCRTRSHCHNAGSFLFDNLPDPGEFDPNKEKLILGEEYNKQAKKKPLNPGKSKRIIVQLAGQC